MQGELIEKIKTSKLKYDLACKMVSQKQESIEEYQNKLELVERSQAICQQVAEQTQSQLSVQLDSLVNLALETLFPGRYRFHLDFDTLRGKTEVKFLLEDLETGKVTDDIVNSNGGGLTDLVSFALRVCLHSLGSTDNVMILDEPFKFVSRNMRSKAANLLKEVSEKLGLQIILITHIDELSEIADKTFNVKQEKGVSNIS